MTNRLNVLPMPTKHDVLDRIGAYRKSAPQGGISRPGFMKLSNFENISICQFGATGFLASRAVVAWTAFVVPTLPITVGHVFSRRSSEEVCRVHAKWIVATVTNMLARLNLAERDRVRNSRCTQGRFVQLESPVTIPASGSNPLPAFAWTSDRNLCPEAFNVLRGKLRVHHCWTSLAGLVVRRAGDVPPSPGFSLPQFYLIGGGPWNG